VYNEFPVTRILSELQYDDLLPAILFRSARKQCDNDVKAIARSQNAQLTREHSQKLKAEVDRVIAKYGVDEQVIYDHPQFSALLKTGVGAHHAGQLLAWRLMLEELMTVGLLRIMVATGTVAAGVDFPARTVVVTAHSKRGAEGFRVLSPSEFQQMSGRAGRRGKDAVGICLIAPSQFCDARVIDEVAKSPPEPLKSSYFASPSTVLNLLKFRNVDDLKHTVSKSLASFHDRKSAEKVIQEAEELQNQLNKVGDSELEKDQSHKKAEKKVRRLKREAEILINRQGTILEASLRGLSRLGHIERGALTEKGLWAAELYTSLVLELAEAIEAGLFYDMSMEELVAMVSSIAGDPHRVYFSLKQNPINPKYYEKMQQLVQKVAACYDAPNKQEVEVLPNAALTVLMWMNSESWKDYSALLRLAGVTEGDAARLITQAADHLNQIARLKETHPKIAETAYYAREQILKPPLVDAAIID